MRIVENFIEEKYCVCPHCGTKLGFIEEDTYNGFDGIKIICPKCHEEITIEPYRPLQFPEAYFYFGGEDATNIENIEIEKWVKQGLKHCLVENEESYATATGNTRVDINRTTDEDEIYFDIDVSRNYWEVTITEEEAKKIIKDIY